MSHQNSLFELTAEIVGAHVRNNTVDANELPHLISSVFASLSGLSVQSEPEAEKLEPAVPVRSSVKPDHLVCLLCGMKKKTLKRHLSTAHDMSPEDYREAFGLRPDYPMVAAEYSETRRELAKKSGLGTKPNQKRGLQKKNL